MPTVLAIQTDTTEDFFLSAEAAFPSRGDFGWRWITSSTRIAYGVANCPQEIAPGGSILTAGWFRFSQTNATIPILTLRAPESSQWILRIELRSDRLLVLRVWDDNDQEQVRLGHTPLATDTWLWIGFYLHRGGNEQEPGHVDLLLGGQTEATVSCEDYHRCQWIEDLLVGDVSPVSADGVTVDIDELKMGDSPDQLEPTRILVDLGLESYSAPMIVPELPQTRFVLPEPPLAPRRIQFQRIVDEEIRSRDEWHLAYCGISAENELLAPPLPVVRDFSATRLDNGSIRFEFRCRRSTGQTAPDRICIHGDNGSGVIDTETPLLELDAQQNQSLYSVTLPAAGAQTRVMVQARNGTLSGPASSSIVLGSASQPITPTFIED